MDRNEFDAIYHKIAPVAYGIAYRIAQDEPLAGKILTNVFQALFHQGKLRQARLGDILATTFACARAALSSTSSLDDIQQQIGAERIRLVQSCEAKTHGLIPTIIPS